MYAQVVKIRSGQRLKYTLTRPIFGTRGQIRDALQALGLSGRIQTAFVECSNLTLRQLIAALHRRTGSKPWSITTLNHRLAWFFAFHHWMRPHQALAHKTFQGHHYKVCTPAMAAGLTDHLWRVDEFLMWRPMPAST